MLLELAFATSSKLTLIKQSWNLVAHFCCRLITFVVKDDEDGAPQSSGFDYKPIDPEENSDSQINDLSVLIGKYNFG